MSPRLRPLLCTLTCTAVCAGSLSLSSMASAAPRSAAGIGDAQRDPAGYTWSSIAISTQTNGAVTALHQAARGLLVAHGPTAAIERLENGVPAQEALLNYPVTAFAGDLASTGDASVDGAADVFEYDGQAWALVHDGAERVAVVAQTRGTAYVFAGSPGADGSVHSRGRRGWETDVATLPGAVPSAAAEHRRAVWVGASPAGGEGPALLFSGRRGRFSVEAIGDPNPAPAAGERQAVTALLSADGFLVIALGTFDAATGQALRGQILLRADGRRGGTTQVASFVNEAPLALGWVDGSLSVGTSAGRLLHQAAGQWVDEPGLPANLAVTALASDASGALSVGVQTAGGALVLQRTAKAPAPPTPPLAPTGLTAVAAGLNVDLTWVDNANDETGFSVERSPAGAATYTEVASLPANSTTYSDTGLTANTAYDYRVTALKGALKSAPSNVASATTGAAPATTLTYAAEVKPILAGDNLLMISCAGCHTNRKYKLSPNLADDAADYQQTLMQVNVGTPEQSELLLRATQAPGHGHPVKLLDVNSPQYTKLINWIKAGAKFN